MFQNTLRFVPSCFVSCRFLSALVCVLFCLSTADLWAPKRLREEDSIAGRVRERRRRDGSGAQHHLPRNHHPKKRTILLQHGLQS